MTIVLHELLFNDNIRPSPYCWRSRLALEHKGLAYEAQAHGFIDIRTAAGGGHKTVPILEDRQGTVPQTICDSAAIADYLERAYPDRPSLYGDGAGRAYARFLETWIQFTVSPPSVKVLVTDLHSRMRPEDRGYFRETREKRFGMSLEAYAAGPLEDRVAAVRATLGPLRRVLKDQPFLSGEAPLYPDHIIAGHLFWWRAGSAAPLLTADDPLHAWFTRILERYPRAARDSTKVWDGP